MALASNPTELLSANNAFQSKLKIYFCSENNQKKYVSAQKTIRKNRWFIHSNASAAAVSTEDVWPVTNGIRIVTLGEECWVSKCNCLLDIPFIPNLLILTHSLFTSIHPSCSQPSIHLFPHSSKLPCILMPDSSNPKERKGDSFFWLTIELYEWLHPSKNTIVKSSPNAKNAVDQILRGSSVKNLKVLRIYPWNIEPEVGKRN